MKVSAIQLAIQFNDPEKNYTLIENKVIETINNEKPDVVLLPEMWNVSFFPDNLNETADVEGKHTKDLLSRLARSYGVNIVGGSVATKIADNFYNTSYSFNREGELVHTYHKVHLFSPAMEHETFTAGNTLGVFELDGVKVGVATCYDLRFVEWIRMMALEGIEILFVPAAWPHPRVFPWQTLQRARAIENQVFVVGLNSVGVTDTLSFCGHSMILSPLGETLSEAFEEETVLTADLDLDSRKEIREQINVFNDRRPELYEMN
ncbi:MAG: carbon-nitrogen family hydrolase [Alkalibacterium sp.]|nr:carbon-nitrogen family hydrolase [Alkalibacterium sp.]